MMRAFRLICGVIIAGISSFSVANEPLKTVPNLDIDSYMGEWYQIAAIPAWFQRKCVGNTTATYEYTGDYVKVTNSCMKQDGKKNVASGLARINKKYSDSARLQVTFASIFGRWIWWFQGDYWVIGLDEGYNTSIVGHPDRTYLWILSHEKELTREKLQELEGKIRRQYYDTCNINITQEGDLKGASLCSLAQN